MRMLTYAAGGRLLAFADVCPCMLQEQDARARREQRLSDVESIEGGGGGGGGGGAAAAAAAAGGSVPSLLRREHRSQSLGTLGSSEAEAADASLPSTLPLHWQAYIQSSLNTGDSPYERKLGAGIGRSLSSAGMRSLIFFLDFLLVDF